MPKDADPRECSIADTLDLVGERWSLLAIRELSYGVRRFDQIVYNTGRPATSSRPGSASWRRTASSAASATATTRPATSTT